jgi:hypothetical protein
MRSLGNFQTRHSATLIGQSADPRPLPPARPDCPTAPLRCRLLQFPSELRALGLPPPQTRAKGRTLWNLHFQTPDAWSLGRPCPSPLRDSAWAIRPRLRAARKTTPVGIFARLHFTSAFPLPPPNAPFRSGKRNPQPAFRNPAKGFLWCQLGIARNARSNFRPLLLSLSAAATGGKSQRDSALAFPAHRLIEYTRSPGSP